MGEFRGIGEIADGVVASVRLKSHAMRRFRAGHSVRLSDKIADLSCLLEIDGFERQLRRDGVVLTDSERAAILARRSEIRAGGADRKHGA